jgi:hypothetical protein
MPAILLKQSYAASRESGLAAVSSIPIGQIVKKYRVCLRHVISLAPGLLGCRTSHLFR